VLCALLAGFSNAAPARDSRGYADALRRADIERSRTDDECGRVAAEFRDDCLARSKMQYEATLDQARKLFPGEAMKPLQPDEMAAYEAELAACSTLGNHDRSGCVLDVKRRFRR
jgi:hypothetical protein